MEIGLLVYVLYASFFFIWASLQAHSECVTISSDLLQH